MMLKIVLLYRCTLLCWWPEYLPLRCVHHSCWWDQNIRRNQPPRPILHNHHKSGFEHQGGGGFNRQEGGSSIVYGSAFGKVGSPVPLTHTWLFWIWLNESQSLQIGYKSNWQVNKWHSDKKATSNKHHFHIWLTRIMQQKAREALGTNSMVQ